jgi:flagellar P-ring protein precursor FlgI
MKLRYWIIVSLVCHAPMVNAARLKELATIRGMKDNQLIGYGMVIGLPGTGDRGDFTESSLDTALKSLGVDPKIQKLGTKNAAAVIVTAILPPFAKVGTKLDVNVSSIGSATSLEGGSLMMTPLKGADGKVYAVSQGRIGVTRRAERGTVAYQSMLSIQIPQAAILEKDVDINFSELKELHYTLHQPDFTTAARIAQRINDELGGKFATATDPGSIDIILPYALEETPVELVARIEGLDVEPDRKARVVVNRKTGAVVLGDNVTVNPVSLAHNNLRVLIQDTGPKDGRRPQSDTVLDEQLQGNAREASVPGDSGLLPNKVTRKVNLINRGTSVADIITSLNEVGANADDIVFVVQSLQSTGALIAEVDFK